VFVYGTDMTLAAGTTTTTLQAIGNGTTDVPVKALLSGLKRDTTYYFQVVASNSGGTTRSAVLSFVTASSAAPPIAVTQLASAVTSTSATLNGSVNPEGSSTDVYF